MRMIPHPRRCAPARSRPSCSEWRVLNVVADGDMEEACRLIEAAADNHGLITSAQARTLGVSNNELVQYARRGRIRKVGRGLYQLVQWVPEGNDSCAWAVASVGPEAVLCGDSVLAMLPLRAPTPYACAWPPQTRAAQASGEPCGRPCREYKATAVYDSVSCQSAADAIGPAGIP